MTTPAPLVTEGKGTGKSWRIVEWAGRLGAGPERDRRMAGEQQKATNGRGEGTKEEQEKGKEGVGKITARQDLTEDWKSRREGKRRKKKR